MQQSISKVSELVTQRSSRLDDSYFIQKIDRKHQQQVLENNNNIRKMDFSQGIRTMRLIYGRIVDIEEFKRDESDEGGDNSGNNNNSKNSNNNNNNI